DSGSTWKSSAVSGWSIAAGGMYERVSDPWVAYGANNDAYLAGIAFNETNPRSAVLVSASHDGGKTFGDPVDAAISNTFFIDKDAIAVDNQTDSPYRGTIYLGWDAAFLNGNSINVSRSIDGGITF